MTPNDTLFASQEALVTCGFPTAWDVVASLSTPPTEVAIVDTGVDLGHSDLDNVSFESFEFPFTDDRGHGTCVTGILGATTNNGMGIAGAAPCRISMYRVFDAHNKISVARYHDALERIAASRARVVNLSIAGLSFDEREQELVDACVAAGKTVIAATGNIPDFPSGSRVFPAALSSVIAVGAADKNGQKEHYSISGDHVFIAAPGSAIWATTLGNDWRQVTGTSFAAPLVAAACALIYQRWPASTPGDVAAKLQRLVANPGADWNPDTGFGLLDVSRIKDL